MSEPTDRRMTPMPLIEAARAYAGGAIAIDPCTEPDNPTRALVHYTRRGLDENWDFDARTALAEAALRGNDDRPIIAVGWLNPPFSNRAPWDSQAMASELPWFVLAAYEGGNKHVARLDARAVARCDLKTRLRCVDPATGKRKDVARAASIWGLRCDLTRFAQSFGHLGGIVPMDIVRSLTALHMREAG